MRESLWKDPDTPMYQPAHLLHFEVEEYLLGEGKDEITVGVLEHSPGAYTDVIVIGKYGNADRASVIQDARDRFNRRNNTWDDRLSMLFLQGPTVPEAVGDEPNQPTEVYWFTFNSLLGQNSFRYSVDTLSRDWLPAGETEVPTPRRWTSWNF